MNDITYTNWRSMSDKALAEHIGAFIKHNRLEQNKTQEYLAGAAGISRSTLSLLERGEVVTVATLIQVLRVLDQLKVMETFVVQKSVSPLAIAKLERDQRQRASGKKKNDSEKSDW